MRAARLVAPGRPLEIRDVALPTLDSAEVLIRVHACGLCGTDLHLAVAGDLPVARTPITLGHEAAGVVAAVGSSVSAVREGDRVALLPMTSCGICRFCSIRRESLCQRSEVFGMARDGALADYIAVPAASTLPLPGGIDFDVAAVVTDGVATPFHALRTRGRLRAGETVGVFGCGGLGTHAVQLARLMGAAYIVAVDIDEHARERARRLGADLVLDPERDDVVDSVRQHVGSAGLDLTLELIGRVETVELAARCLGRGGRCVAVGVGSGRPTLPTLAAFVGREQSFLGSFGMDRVDIIDLYRLIATRRLDVSSSISARYPLERANAALRHLADRRDGVVRVVVEPAVGDGGGEN